MAFRTRDVCHIPSECRGYNSFCVVNRPHWKNRVKKDKAKPSQSKAKGVFIKCRLHYLSSVLFGLISPGIQCRFSAIWASPNTKDKIWP